MNKETPLPFMPVLLDTDSHKPTIVSWSCDHAFTKLVMYEYGTSGLRGEYKIVYPEPQSQYTYGSVTEATGKLKIREDGIVLDDATVKYEDGSSKTNGVFYITITEGTHVTDVHTGETTIVTLTHNEALPPHENA